MNRMPRYLWLLLLAFLLLPSTIEAACSGSGLSWSCSAGSTAAQINSAISSASDGATITLDNGTYSFTGVSLNPRNGVTIQCATVRGCTLTGSGTVFSVSTPATTHITNLMRISGFVFTATGGTTISLGYVAGNPWMDKLRIDNCTFNNTTGIAIATGHTQSTRRINGVIDHNIFQGSTHNYPLMILGAGENDWGPSLQGTSENLFVEDNVFNYGSENLGASGMDAWNGARLVVRHNDITNARVAVHGVCHGGPANLEIYNNTISNTSSDGGYRIIHHQGSGEFMVFNNVINPTSASMALLYYRSMNPNPEGCGVCDGTQSIDGNRSPGSTYRGYPCYRQPGRTGDKELRPVYLWNNKYANGSQIKLSVELETIPHILPNRDYYEAVSTSAQTSPTSPFNGTSGMGFGTLANRPVTCTPTPEALDAGKGGVGYFAVDTNILYHCSAPNTWSVQYRPYAYPHPLIAESQGPLCTTTLSPGANVASAVSSAAAGSTICLNDGNYGSMTLADVSKSDYVTIRSLNPKGASLGSTQIGNSDYIRIEDVVINGVGINACSQHIQIKNNTFSGQGLWIRNDNGCTPTTNLDILIDGNTFNNLPGAIWEGRLSINASPDPSGITISNNTFGGGGCSDGIQLVGNTGGVHIGPGNIFRDLIQGSCGPHVDAIQGYTGGGGNVIEGNYYYNNTVHIGIYDGGSNYTVRNNVFDRPNSLTYQALQLGGIDTMLMEHNTFKDTLLGVGTKFANSPNTNWTVQNNIFDNSNFTAAGDQPGCGSNCVMRYNLKSRGGTTTPAGSNNITGDAVYTGTGSVSNWASWQLAAGSPGLGAGNDGQDMGTLYYGSGTVPSPSDPADTTAPSVPSGLAANVVSSTQINLTWSASTDNVGVTGYRVERCSGSNCTNFSQIATPSGTSYNNTGLSANTTYRYRVRAGDAAGNLSGYSSTVSATTQSSSGGGSGTTETIWGSRTSTSFNSDNQPWDLGMIFTPTVDGQAVGARVYGAPSESGTHSVRLWRNDGTLLSGPHSFTYSGEGWHEFSFPAPVALTANTAYTVTVSTGGDSAGWYTTMLGDLVSGGNNGAHLTYPANAAVYSNTIGVRPTQSYQSENYFRDVMFVAGSGTPPPADTTAPSAPASLAASAVSSSQINLSWAASTDNVGVTGYQLQRCQGTGCTNFAQVATPSGTSYNDTGLSASTAYRYRVRATDAAGNLSGFSSTVAATTQAQGSTSGCSGSGLSWSCAAGSTAAQVQSAINSASDGATIVFQAGSYSWSSGINFSSSKGVSLICEAQHNCIVSGSSILGENGSCSGTSTKLYRVSGFEFTGNNAPRFWWYGPSACSRTQIRVDHNLFSSAADSATIMYFGENSSSDNYFSGVVDHNTVTTSGSVYLAQMINGNSDNAPTGSLGSGNNLFFEDNTITVTSMTNSGSGCFDMWGGHGAVWRHNTVTNCRVLAHGVTHAWGSRNFEIYDNTITHTSGSSLKDGYRSIHHQGSGTWMVFNNTITPFSGHSSDAIALLHYRSWTSGSGQSRCDSTVSVDGNRSPTSSYYGYPCKRQPGRDSAGTLSPVYVWGNHWGDVGTHVTLACNDQGESNPNTCQHHVVANRDYYNAVSLSQQTSLTSPFNGTTGMGYGPLANRPTTCTTGPEALDAGKGGVGYFATDDGPQGTLYQCSSTNTWTPWYTPYAYPHPLVAGSQGGLDDTPPSVSLTAPSSGASVSGTATVSASASDNVGVVGVQFKLDGTNLGAEDTTSPYSIAWDTTTATSGSHSLTAVARDAAGNTTTSAVRSVTVTAPADTTGPSAPSGLTANVTSSSQINLSWNAATDNVSVTGYQLQRCQGTGCTNFAQIATPSGTSYNNTGLSANTTYRYRVRATDAAGNFSSFSSTVAATTQSGGAGGGNMYYIRDGGTSSTCTDWANACDTLPNTLQRGATYYVADGSYGSYAFDDAVSGTQLITIKKATQSDHGTDTGWQSAYGDGQADFAAPVTFSSSHWLWDGAVRNESNWFEGSAYGFKIRNNSNAAQIQIKLGAPLDDLTVKHTWVEGRSGPFVGTERRVAIDCETGGTSTNLTFHRNLVTDSNQHFFLRNTNTTVVEYNASDNMAGNGDYHGNVVNLYFSAENAIVRFNQFRDIGEGSGWSGITNIISIADSRGTNTPPTAWIYGNLVYRFSGGDGAFGFLGNTANGGNCTNCRVFNNTLVDGDMQFRGGWGVQFPDGSGNIAQNNLFISGKGDSPGISLGSGGVNSHNGFGNGGGQSGTNAQSNIPLSIFVNYTQDDYRLSGPTSPGAAITGTAPDGGRLDVDMFGNVRGADGVWDRGAFEYSGGGSTPPAPTATLTANPASITNGSSSTLTWASTNATSCTGSGFSTGGAVSGTATVSPTADATYSVSCTGAGGSVSASASVAVTTPGGGGGGTPVSVFTAQTPADTNLSDCTSCEYELGMRFQSSVAGEITAIKFWKSSSETGIHTGRIWSSTGTQLASVEFTNETSSGWQTQALGTPLAIQANTTYTVSVNTGNTFYADTVGGLASAVTNGSLSTVVGNNGVFSDAGSAGTYPTNTWNDSNYFRDVVFVARDGTPPPADTTAPSAPSGLAANVASSTQINLSWAASTDNVGVTGYQLQRCQGTGCTNFAQIATPSGTSYNDTGLSASTAYRYRVRAADAAGNLSGFSSTVAATTQGGGSSSSGNWYVRPNGGAYGSENGTDWNNAYDGFSGISWSAISCGDTIWVAGGTYTQSLAPAKTGCTSTSRITIARARADAAAATSAAGWSSSFDAMVRHTASIDFDGNWDYITISGRTTANGGSNGWWLDRTTKTGGYGVGYNISGADNNTIEYMDLQGPGEINYTSDGRAIDCTPPSGSVTGNTFSHLKIWDWESGIYVVSCPNVTVEYIDMYDIAPLNWVTYHPNGIITWASPNGIVRYSKFHRGPAGLGIGEGIFLEQMGGSTGWQIYGNLFYDLNATGWKSIEIASNAGAIKIYNNTFDNTGVPGVYVNGGSCGSGAEVRDNLGIQTSYDNCGAMSNNVSSAAASVFVNRAGRNYHLTSAQPGVSLAAAYNSDMDGQTRGADGVWDIGAYEYAGGGSTPPVPTATLTANPASITNGSSSTLTWASTNATSCTGSGFSMGGAVSGTATVSPTSNTTYSMSCTGAGGSDSASASVTVTAPADTTAPSTPSGLTASVVSLSQINLSWAASTDNVGVTGYQLQRCQGTGCTNFAQIATPSGTSYNNTGLSANTTYRYRVRATDAAGNLSSFSSTVAATTTAVTTGPDVISADRRIDWTYAGVPGGIPHRTTICAQLGTPNQSPGYVQNVTTAVIKQAIGACPANQVVYLNPGTYNVSGITLSKDHISIRGAGPGRTIIRSGTGSPAFETPQAALSYNPTPIVGGYTKGDTQITVGNASSYGVNDLIKITQDDDPSFVMSTGGPGRNMIFISRVTAINGNTLTLATPMPMSVPASRNPTIGRDPYGSSTAGVGIENMTIQNTGHAGSTIAFWQAYSSWVKNVEITEGSNDFVFFYESLQCEVRDSYMHDAENAPNNADGYAILFWNASYNKAENNVFENLWWSVDQNNSSANAVLYNYSWNSVGQGWTHQVGAYNSNHRAHPLMTLWEGNVGQQWQNDGYHGSGSHQTLYRNWFHGLHPTSTTNRKMLDLARASYYHNVLGNVLGSSWASSANSTSRYEMQGEPGYDQQQVIYRLGYPNVSSNGYSASVPWPSTYGLSYPDQKVNDTLLRWGNYDYYNGAARFEASEVPGDMAVPATQNLPASLYYTNKPAWWPAAVAWPPIGPDVTGGNADPAGHVYKIPANVCYEQGNAIAITDCLADGAATTPGDTTAPTVSLTAPGNGASVSGNVTVSASASDNVGVVGVQFKIDEVNLGVEDATSPYSIAWDTTTATSGSHSLTAVARDAAGNTTTSAARSVTVSNVTADTTAPSAPNGLAANVASSSQINLSWNASTDNVGVTGYQLQRCQGTSCTNFTQIATPSGTSYNDTGLSANTTYRYRVRATDAAGNLSGFSTTVAATTQSGGSGSGIIPMLVSYTTHTCTDAPCYPSSTTSFTYSNIQQGNLLVVATSTSSLGTCTVSSAGETWSHDIHNVNSAGVTNSLDIWSLPNANSGNKSIAVNCTGGASSIRVLGAEFSGVAANNHVLDTASSSGNSSTPNAGSVTTDTNNTLLFVAARTDGDLQGWSAGSGYTILNDCNAEVEPDQKLCMEAAGPVPAGTYSGSFSINPESWVAGVVAYAPADSGGTADTTAPTVSLTAPGNGATVSGTTTVSASASDNVGVVGVQFKLDGANLGSEDTTSPYSMSWNTTTATNGSHSLTAVARDAAGNTTTSTSRTVTVSNATSSSGTLGNTSNGGSPDSSNSHYINAIRFSMGSTGGSAQSMSVYVAAPVDTAPNNQYSMAIYEDNGGSPGALVAQTANGTLTGDAWNTLPISANLSANTIYWLSYNTNGTSIGVNNFVFTDGSEGQMVWRAQAFGAWPTAYGAVEGSSSSTASIYVTYGSAGGATPPTATLTANPASITSGNSSTLTWASTNATSCTGSGFSTGGAVSGTATVSPTANATYSVTCTGAGGSASASASVAVTVPADTTAPSVPSGLATSVVSTSQINLSWAASTDNVGVTGYRVERCQGTGCTNFVQIATQSGASYNNTGLSASTTYRYRVRATDAAGNLSGFSSTVAATTQSLPVPTATLTANPVSITSGDSSTLTWLSTNATSCTGTGFATGGNANGTATVSPTADATYTVTCTGSGGSASASADVSVTVPPPTSGDMPFYDGFESVMDWTKTGNVDWSTGDPKNGTHAVQLSLTGSIEKHISLQGYENVTVSFSMGSNSLENGWENVKAMYYDGTAWQLLAQITDGDANDDGQLHAYSVNLPATVNNLETFALKFQVDASGTGDYGFVDDVMVRPETTIFSDGFESGINWSETGDVDWHNGNPKMDSHSVRLRLTGMIEKAISLAGYEQVTVSFNMGGHSLENGWENVQALYYDGTGWRMLAKIVDPDEDSQLHAYSFDLPETVDNLATFALRFLVDASGTGDFGFVDDVSVRGVAAVPGGSTTFVSQTSAPLNTVAGGVQLSGDSAMTSLSEPLPVPTAALSADPVSITSGDSSKLTWTSTNATSCTGGGFSTGGETSGSVAVFPAADTTYTVTCTGAGGSASASMKVAVLEPPVSSPARAPTAAMSADPTVIKVGESSLLRWASTDATACAGEGFSTGGSAEGSITVAPTATTTYGVACSGPGGVARGAVTVEVDTSSGWQWLFAF